MIPGTRNPQPATRSQPPATSLPAYQTFTGLDKPIQVWQRGRHWYIRYETTLGPFFSYAEMRWNLAELIVSYILGERK